MQEKWFRDGVVSYFLDPDYNEIKEQYLGQERE
jgi:hypothetical protein